MGGSYQDGGQINALDIATGETGTAFISGTDSTPTTLTFAPASLTFAAQTLSTTSAAQNIVVTNTGTVQAFFSSAMLIGGNSGDFSIGAFETYLNAGQSENIPITFTPRLAGARTTTLKLTSNDQTSPDTIQITGTGK